MQPLPFVDDHSRVITASPERVWSALLEVVAGMTGRELPGPLVRAWGLAPAARAGDWAAPAPGDTITGFAVADIDPPRLLGLRGRHRFSDYELRFTLEPGPGERVELHALSFAQFPGPLGAVYRTLVIGSRGHVLAVRRMLAHVAGKAERPA